MQTAFSPDGSHLLEMQTYIHGQYVCVSKALWRILGLHTTEKTPTMKCLAIHLQDKNTCHYNSQQLESSISTLERYFLPTCT